MSKELAQEMEPIEKEDQAEIEAEGVKEPVVEEKPEVEAEGKEEEKTPEKPPKGFVPQGALHEERERRKELQRQLAQTEAARAQRDAVIEARLQQMQQAWMQQNAPKPPSFDEDPVAALKHGLDQTQEELRQTREQQAQEYRRYQEWQAQQAYIAQVKSVVSEAEAEFKEETPDYLEAVNYLHNVQRQQLRALGCPADQIEAAISNESLRLANTALNNRVSPAQAAYQSALAAGWKKPETEKPAENVQKMETLQKGTKAAQSLGSGGTPAGKLTVDAVAQMSDDEFGDFMKSGGWSKLG